MVLDKKYEKYRHKSGIYIISSQRPTLPNNTIVSLKIGKSENLYSRLDSYHICFPEGYYIWTIITTDSKYYTDQLEKDLHKYLNEHECKYVSNSGYLGRKFKSEWFKCHKVELRDKVQKVLYKFRKDHPNSNLRINTSKAFILK